MVTVSSICAEQLSQITKVFGFVNWCLSIIVNTLSNINLFIQAFLEESLYILSPFQSCIPCSYSIQSGDLDFKAPKSLGMFALSTTQRGYLVPSARIIPTTVSLRLDLLKPEISFAFSVIVTVPKSIEST